MHWNRQFFRLEALFALDETSRTHHLEIYYDAVRRKAVKLNGVRYGRLRALPVRLAAVLFTPDDLGIIKGGPAERRVLSTGSWRRCLRIMSRRATATSGC